MDDQERTSSAHHVLGRDEKTRGMVREQEFLLVVDAEVVRGEPASPALQSRGVYAIRF